MIKRVVGIYYSPTGETAKLTKRIANEIAAKISDVCLEDIVPEYLDVLIVDGSKKLQFDDEAVVVVGMPSQGGRLSQDCVDFIMKLRGNNTLTIACVAYGGSTYGDALFELHALLESRGFQVVSAVATVTDNGRRSIGSASRPDAEDFRRIMEFCELTANKMKRFCGSEFEEMMARPMPLLIKGQMPRRGIRGAVITVSRVTIGRINFRRREPEWFL